MGKKNLRQIGNQYEEMAAEYLRDRGYIILARNYNTRYSEIDIVAQGRDELVFVEVKYRSTKGAGDPLSAVDMRKQMNVRRAAERFLMDKGYNPETTNIRFDVIGILGDELKAVENAF